MQHGERNSAGELPVGKWHGGGIARNHLDIAAAQTSTERVRQLRIQFDGSEVRRTDAHEISCDAGPRAQLEDVLPKVRIREHPGYALLNGFSPAIRAAQPNGASDSPIPSLPLSFGLVEISGRGFSKLSITCQ